MTYGLVKRKKKKKKKTLAGINVSQLCNICFVLV